MPNRMIRLVTTSIVAFAASAGTLAQQFEYPKARKVDQVDTYHGIAVADPYRWMEDDNAADTAAWVEAENKLTFGYLEKIPFRKPLTDRVVALNNYEKVSAPSRKGPYVFFRRNEGLQKQSVLYVQKGMQGAPEVLIDPNTWSEDGTTRLTIFVPSGDAKYAVYGVSKSGSDWEEFKIMELATRKTLTDSLEWVKVSSVGWQGDGFYYSRYPAPDKGKEKAAINEGHQVYFHKVGTPQSQDTLTLTRTRPMRSGFTSRYDRGRALRDPDDLRARQGQGRKRGLRPRPVEGREELRPVLPEIGDDTFNVLDNVGDKLLIETNHKAPNERVILVDPKQPAEANWKTILPEKPEPLQGAGTAGGKLFATYLKDVSTKAYVYSVDGKLENEVQLPGPGVASGFGGNHDDAVVFYTFNSLNTPPTIFSTKSPRRTHRYSASQKCRATTQRSSRRSRSSIPARTAHECPCSSCTRRA